MTARRARSRRTNDLAGLDLNVETSSNSGRFVTSQPSSDPSHTLSIDKGASNINALVDRTIEQYLDSGDLSMLMMDERSKSEEMDPNLMSFRSGKDLQI